MKLISFEAENFKGIERITINLEGSPDCNVYCFVGLNESGKTTVLESLDAYNGWTETLKPVTSSTSDELDVKMFIPKSKISNFSGDITVSVTCRLEPDDMEAARQYAKSELGYTLESVGPELIRYQNYGFEDSVYTGEEHRFVLAAKGRKGKSKKSTILNVDNRRKLAQLLSKRMPAVLYFPNALFDTPDQIVIDEDGGTAKDAYYRMVIQDALDAIGDGHILQKHIVARIGVDDQKEALDNTVRKLEAKISSVVFRLWKDILGKPLVGKRITIEAVNDAGANVLRLRYADGADSYKISERSLGFRWFFGFLLLTHFRRERLRDTRQVIYVFDEPASNLHSTAQQQLLETFGHLSSNASVIYSTHSHHLINPAWLENAYVVRNTGLTYEEATDDFSLPSTKVEVERYRKFVAEHPDQTTYFQPILDVLDYRPSNLELVPKVVFVEGKNDFYTLKMFQSLPECPKEVRELTIVPGNGANGIDPLIRLYLGWGASFKVLLDGDGAGIKAKAKILKDLGAAVDGRVYTLSDVVAGFRGAMEDIFSQSDKANLLKAVGMPTSKDGKAFLNRAIQEIVARGHFVQLEQATVARFAECLRALKNDL